ncbi:InlB B-repeat-containing protein [Sphaerochaeta sp.]|uniref:InlB B-repeat-containing protein n=1 Tax=Sphaerochaeta sp. TaxID=1972642 RepID=UPI002FC6FB46
MQKRQAFSILLVIVSLVFLTNCQDQPPYRYTITYVVSGGTNNPANPSSYQTDDETITLADASRQGYTFAGWYSTDEYTEPAVSQIPTGSLGNITLYAKWIANTYLVSFLSHGATPDPEPLQVTFDAAYGSLPEVAFTETGYTFGGWFTAEGGNGTSITNEKLVLTASDHTLHAYKQPLSYTISYQMQGGTNHPSNQEHYTIETQTCILSDPSRNGYTFQGWYADALFTEPAIVQIEQGSTGDRTLYAKWQILTYTLSYSLNGGTNHPDNGTAYNVEDTINLKNATKNAYDFLGWYKNDAGSGDPLLVLQPGTTGNKTLYALWAPTSYAITYQLNGGVNTNANPSYYCIEDDAITLADPGKTGYTFISWFDNAQFSGSPVTAIPAGSQGDRVVYASWTPNVYSVTYHLNGGTNAGTNPTTYTIESETITLSSPSKENYTFNGWYPTGEYSGSPITQIPHGTTEDRVLYANWSPTAYLITYVLNGGTNAAGNPQTYTIESDTINLAEAHRPGYRFDGWYPTLDYAGSPITQIPHGSTQAITLSAKWTAHTYTVTFNAGAGSAAEPPTKQVTYDSPYADLATTSRLGYSFDGWYTAMEGTGAKIGTGTSVSIAENHTLYANWIADAYIITFDAGAGMAANPATKQVWYDSAYGELSNTERTGYSLEGWYTGPDGTGTNVEASTIMHTNSAHTLYAHWNANTYRVQFVTAGGSPVSDIQATFDQPYGVLPASSRNGYTFQGWYTGEGGSGTKREAESVVSTSTDHSLYAYFKPITYTISYTLNAGTNDAGNPVSYTVETTTITLQTPTRTGYTFEGWYGTSDFSTSAISYILQGSTGNQTVYARWSPTVYSITYQTAGGENNAANPQSYTIEDDAITLADPAKTGYTFLGWYADGAFSSDRITSIPKGSIDNRILWAKWTPIIYTIGYELNAGTNDAANPVSYTVEDRVVLADPTRNYYDFLGWYENDGFTIGPISTLVEGTIGNKTLHAKWKPTEYPITYHLDGGTNASENPSSYHIESATITFADPTKPNYYFAGWFTESSLATMQLSIEGGSHAPVTVYAKWKPLYQIGDAITQYPGGVVFYDMVDYDYRVDSWRYLAAITQMELGTFPWIAYDSTYDTDAWTGIENFRLVGGTSPAIGTGLENSQAILTKAAYRNSAANACASFQGDGNIGSWHLPSQEELYQVYRNLYLDSGFETPYHPEHYWTSTESGLDQAYCLDFATGNPQEIGSLSNTYKVIPIRRL